MKFSPLPIEAISDSRLSKTDLRVLAALHYFNGEKGCFPSRPALCELTKLAPQKVSASSTRLIGFGWIEKAGRAYVLHSNCHQFGDIKSHQSSDPIVTEVVTLKVTDSVTDSHQSGDKKVTSSVTRNRTKQNIEQNKEQKRVEEVLSHFELVTGNKFPSDLDNYTLINARLNTGSTVEDLKRVVDFKYRDWRNTEFAQYLRPQTLFKPDKFPGYLSAANSQAGPVSSTTQKNMDNLSGWVL